MIERDPFRSLVHWIYIFDYRERRHLLGLTRIDQGNKGSRILINRYMVRKGVTFGNLERTPLASQCLTMPKNDPAFLDHLIDDPYALGGPVVDFIEQQFCRLIAHTGCSAHEQLRQMSSFKKNLASTRASRKRTIPREAVDRSTMCQMEHPDLRVDTTGCISVHGVGHR